MGRKASERVWRDSSRIAPARVRICKVGEGRVRERVDGKGRQVRSMQHKMGGPHPRNSGRIHSSRHYEHLLVYQTQNRKLTLVHSEPHIYVLRLAVLVSDLGPARRRTKTSPNPQPLESLEAKTGTMHPESEYEASRRWFRRQSSCAQRDYNEGSLRLKPRLSVTPVGCIFRTILYKNQEVFNQVLTRSSLPDWTGLSVWRV